MSLGIYLTLLLGEKKPAPAPAVLMDALQKVVVTVSDDDSGFQIVFSTGRGNSADATDYTVLDNDKIKLFNRVIIIASLGVVPKVLMDGVIITHQFNPSLEPGKSTFTITGSDLSVMMDIQEQKKTWPNQGRKAIVTSIIDSYSAEYGLKAEIKAEDTGTPDETDVINSQQVSDLEYIRKLAGEDNVFYIEPTAIPEVNTAYLGPPDRESLAQKKLLFNMGEFTNVNSLDIDMNVLKQNKVEGQTQDTETGGPPKKVQSVPDDKEKLAAKSVTAVSKEKQVITQMRESGWSLEEAANKAKEAASKALDAVTLTGELDTIRYGEVLKARHPVEIIGVGQLFNGKYYVKKVTHTITKGSYKQNFTLTREGTGTTT